MSTTVEQAMNAGKGIARAVRELVQQRSAGADPYDLMVINRRVAQSLRTLANELDSYEYPDEEDVV